MSISDFNPVVLLFLCFVALAAFGMMLGALRRSSPGRYDVRDDER